MMKYKHGLCYTNLYRRWINMRSRCNNSNSTKYHLYGGKGIKVCAEWENNFLSFYNWSIKNGYKKGLTLDRINGNDNYKPSNCRWVTYKIQSRNTTQNHMLTYNGQTKCIYEWAEYLGISKKMLSERIRRGWSIERALNTPNVKKNGYNFGKYIQKYKRGDIPYGAKKLPN